MLEEHVFTQGEFKTLFFVYLTEMFLSKCRRCNLSIEKQAVSSSDGQLKGKYHKECFNCDTCYVSNIFVICWKGLTLFYSRNLSLIKLSTFTMANLSVPTIITKRMIHYALLLVVGNLSKALALCPIPVTDTIPNI